MRCRTCSKGSLIEIRMRVAGEDVTFRRCGRCETKSWATLDGQVSLRDVLQLARPN